MAFGCVVIQEIALVALQQSNHPQLGSTNLPVGFA